MNSKQKDDFVFIVESIDDAISVKNKDSKSYEFEAVVAKFGIVNENGREYQREDYLAQLPQLKERISKSMLMGELDHPQSYDTTIKNVSHLITDIWYDEQNDCVKVKLRLLDTIYGNLVKGLVDDGVQISISSRSAGKVDANGIVSLYKIFTFDLVAEPGFAQAMLQPVVSTGIKENLEFISESLNTLNEKSIINKLDLLMEGKLYGDNAKIYKISENEVKQFEQKISKNNFNKMNDSITRSEFNEYTKRIAAKLDRLLEAKDDESQAQAQSQAQPGAQAQAQAQSQAQPGAQAQAQAQSQAQPGAQAQAQAQSQAQPGAQAQAQAQSQAQPGAQAQAQAQSQAQPGAQAQGYAQPGAQAQPYAQPAAQTPGFGAQAQPQMGFDGMGADSSEVPNIQDTFNTVQQLIQYINFLAKQIEAVMGHSEVVTEALNKSINYSEKIGQTLNEHIAYTNAQGKLLNEAIGYSQELAGIINANALVTDKTVKYSNLLGTRLNESIELSNVIADKTQKAIEFTEFNAQLFNEHVDFTNVLANEINSTNFTNAKAEGVDNRNLSDNVATITESASDVTKKVDMLLEKIADRSNEAVLESQYPFLALLSESNRKEFYRLDNNTKAEVVATLRNGFYANEADVISTIHNIVESKNSNLPKYLKLMPEKYKAIYEGLSEFDKAEIAKNAASGFYRLNTPYQVKTFWDSQKMAEREQIIKENKQLEEIRMLNESKCQGKEGLITAQQYADYSRGYDDSFIKNLVHNAKMHK